MHAAQALEQGAESVATPPTPPRPVAPKTTGRSAVAGGPVSNASAATKASLASGRSVTQTALALNALSAMGRGAGRRGQ